MSLWHDHGPHDKLWLPIDNDRRVAIGALPHCRVVFNLDPCGAAQSWWSCHRTRRAFSWCFKYKQKSSQLEGHIRQRDLWRATCVFFGNRFAIRFARSGKKRHKLDEGYVEAVAVRSYAESRYHSIGLMVNAVSGQGLTNEGPRMERQVPHERRAATWLSFSP